jgi:apolipoprotein N-acyltransferase
MFNTVTSEGDRHYNAVLTVASDGVLGSYAKRHLVPYGEYVPLADTFSFIGTLARQAGSFTPGTGAALLPWGRERIGMAICYEVVFPAAVAEQVQAGATVLATVTNDAWYGDSTAPWQHFRAARFRAAENRRPMLRAALTGVSGVIDSRGRVKTQAGVGEHATLYAWVDGQTAFSPYSKAPRLVPSLAFGVALFAIVFARLAEPRPKRRHDVDPKPSKRKTHP